MVEKAKTIRELWDDIDLEVFNYLNVRELFLAILEIAFSPDPEGYLDFIALRRQVEELPA